MKRIIIFTLVLAVVMLLPQFATDVFAPPAGPPAGTGGGSPIGGGATGAPIDGGLGFLAAAGIAYAGKKLKDRKKAKAENND